MALFLGVVDYLFSQGYNYLLSVAPKETATEIDFAGGAPEIDISTETAAPEFEVLLDESIPEGVEISIGEPVPGEEGETTE